VPAQINQPVIQRAKAVSNFQAVFNANLQVVKLVIQAAIGK
jgi:hypothetical protein